MSKMSKKAASDAATPPEAYEHILYEVVNDVAHIILNRPDKLNAMGMGPGTSRDEIERALLIASDDDSVGCVVIRANGRAFCAGGDLNKSAKAGPDTVADNLRFNQAMMKLNASVRSVRKPVIAAVHGLCMGTAMGFVSQCDFVIAADDTRFGLVEGRIGHPGASDLVPVIGPAWTKYLIFTGEIIDAARAVEMGFVLTVEPLADLKDRVTLLAERIARMPREGVFLNKTSIENVMEASGRAAGRLAGRGIDAITMTMGAEALAPDGRKFADILKSEGVAGMKAAREQQYTGTWLPPLGWKDTGGIRS